MVVSVLVIAGIVIFADHLKAANGSQATKLGSDASSQIATQSDSPDTSTTAPATSQSSSSASTYKDGTYAATSDYFVPHSDETIQVKLTLNNGTITQVSIANSESDRESAEYQEEFASLYKSHVVGKKIDGLRLTIIAGASDTTEAFNEALSRIASKAQA